jgi:hypothetical protein
MRFRFIGQYTNGHTSNTAHGVTFEGHEPAEVTDAEAVRRLSGNPEFEAVAGIVATHLDPMPDEDEAEQMPFAPAKRTYKRRAAK